MRPLDRATPTRNTGSPPPLELFTDLCFVVAVSQAAASLHHSISEGQVGHGAVYFALAFFGVFWAWLNFTWFGSAYDNDDLAYRLLTILQIFGALVFAAGIPRMFEGELRLGVTGYVIMRIALVTQWLRVSRPTPSAVRRPGATPRAWSSSRWDGSATSWCRSSVAAPALSSSVALRARRTRLGGDSRPHPVASAPHRGALLAVLHHRARRGDPVVHGRDPDGARRGLRAGQLGLLIAGGVPLVFSLWWLYFSREDADLLLERSNRANMVWGFGHYFVFAPRQRRRRAGGPGRPLHPSLGVVGPGDGCAVTIPTAVLVVSIYVFHLKQHDRSLDTIAVFMVGVVVVLAGTFTAVPELVAGLTCAPWWP